MGRLMLTPEEAQDRLAKGYQRAISITLNAERNRLTDFEAQYGTDYVTKWHTPDEFNKYYSDLEDARDYLELYKSYYNTYGTDEQKSSVADLDNVIVSYNDALGAKDSIMSHYSPYATADQYQRAMDFQAEKIAERNMLSTLNLDDAQSNIDAKEIEISTLRAELSDLQAGKIRLSRAEKEKKIGQLQLAIARANGELSELKNTLHKASKIQEGNEWSKYKDAPDFAEMSVPKEMFAHESQTYNAIFYPEAREIYANMVGNSGTSDDYIYDLLEPTEKDMVAYLDKVYGWEKAEKYLDFMTDELINRRAKSWYEFGQEHKIAAYIAAVPINLVSGIEAVGNILTGAKHQNLTSAAAQALRGGASSTIDSDLGKFLYNTGTSLLDSATAFGISALTGMPVLGSALLGGSATASTMNDMISRGARADQVIFTGIAAGIFEALFESFSLGATGAIKNLTSMQLKNSVLNTLKDMGISTLVNASEEAVTEVANILYDTIVNGEFSDATIMVEQLMARGYTQEEAVSAVVKTKGMQIGEAAASGALMGPAFGGLGVAAGTVAREIGYRSEGADIKNSTDDTANLETLLKSAEAYSSVSRTLNKAASKVTEKGEKVSNRQVGKLKAELIQAQQTAFANLASETFLPGIKTALEEQGLSGKTLDKTATAIGKYFGGERNKLSLNEGKLLESEAAKNVIDSYKKMIDEADEETRRKLNDIAYDIEQTADSGMRARVNARASEISEPSNEAEQVVYGYGSSGMTWDATKFKIETTSSNSEMLRNISQLRAYELWKIGREEYVNKNETERENKKAAAIKAAEAEGKKHVRRVGKYDDSKARKRLKQLKRESVRGEEQKKLYERTEAALTLAEMIAKFAGIDVYVIEGEPDVNGKITSENGLYVLKEGKNTQAIYIDINAGINDMDDFIKAAIIPHLSHEVTHSFRVNASTQYEKLSVFIQDYLTKQGYSVEALVKQRQDAYMRKHGKELSPADALEEVIARACEERMGNSKAVKEFVSEMYAKDKTLAEKFVNEVKKFIAKINEWFDIFAKQESVTVEAEKMKGAGDEFQRLWDEAFKEAVKGYQVLYTGKSKSTSEKKTVKNSLREDFAEEYDNWDKKNPRKTFIVGTTSKALQSLGIEEKPITWDSAKIIKIKGKHPKMTDDVIKQVPNILEYPIVIMESRTKDGRLTFFGEVYADGKPVLAVLELSPTNKDGIALDELKIASAYRKDGAQRLLYNSEILYRDSDKKRVTEWEKRTRLQLPVGYSSDNSTNSITEKAQVVNSKISENEKIMYSEREDVLTSAEIVRNIFEKNPKYEGYEKNAQQLDKYKLEMQKKERNVQRIRDIDKKIKQLRRLRAQSGKGTQMDDLHQSRRIAERRIAEAEAKMLEYEAQQLQRVIEAERKKMIKELTEELEGKRSGQVSEIRIKQAKKEFIERISRKTKDLQEKLLKNTKDKHIPEDFKKPLAEFLATLDFTPPNTRNRKGGETKRAQNARVAYDNLMNWIKAYANTHVEDLGYIDIQDDLAEMLNEQKEKMLTAIESLGSESHFRIYNMDSQQLETLNRVLREVQMAVNKANSLKSEGSFKHVAEMAQESMEHNESFRRMKKGDKRGLRDFFEWDNTLPVYAFKRLGEAGRQLFSAFQDGFDELIIRLDDASNFTLNLYTDKEYEKWCKEIHTFDLETYREDADGKVITKTEKVTLNVPQIMSLYCLEKRKQGLGHTRGGGIYAPTPEGAKVPNGKNGAMLTEDSVKEILSKLDKRQKHVADQLQRYMSTTCAKWGNRVSMARWGYLMFTEEFYFPIDVYNPNKIDDKATSRANSMYKLLDMRFMKPTDPNAKGRVVLYDIFDVFASHAADMARMSSLSLPVLDFVKWYSYREKVNGDERTLKNSLEDAFGKGIINYLDNFISDISGVVEVRGNGVEFLADIVKNAKTMSVGANLRSTSQQPMSATRAMLLISPKYMSKAILQKPNREKLKKWCPMALYKSMGYLEPGTGKGFDTLIKHDESGLQKVREGTMKGMELLDELTWGYLWNAIELEISDKHPELVKDSDEYNMLVAKRMRDIIYYTQVVDSPMSKSDIMRSSNSLTRQLTAFMSEATVTYNMLLDVYEEGMDSVRQGGKFWTRERAGKACRIIAIYTLTALQLAAVTSFIDAMRDDDYDEEYFDKYGEAFLANIINEMNPLSKLPWFRDFFSAIEGYYTQRTDTAIFNYVARFIRDIQKIFSKGITPYEVIYDALKLASASTGIGASNLMRDVVAIWNSIMASLGYKSLIIE